MGIENFSTRPHYLIFLIIVSLSALCSSLHCPCNVGPCPSLSNNLSILDTCTRLQAHAFCVRTVNLTVSSGRVGDIREIYRCANFLTTHHEEELMIHIPKNDHVPITIEYRCKHEDQCSLEQLRDEDCDATNFHDTKITSEEIRNIFPSMEKADSNNLTICNCVDEINGKAIDREEKSVCRWTNDARLDSGRELPFCDEDDGENFRDDLRASIFCRGDVQPRRRFRCNFACKYADYCNRPEDFEKIYCAAIKQLATISKLKPVTLRKTAMHHSYKSLSNKFDPLEISKLSGESTNGNSGARKSDQNPIANDSDTSKSPNLIKEHSRQAKPGSIFSNDENHVVHHYDYDDGVTLQQPSTKTAVSEKETVATTDGVPKREKAQDGSSANAKTIGIFIIMASLSFAFFI